MLYRVSEDIGNREKALNLNRSSLQSSLCSKAVANVVENTGSFSKKSESKPDIGLKSKSDISSNKHNSTNEIWVDSSTSCSTDVTMEDDTNSVNDGNTLKSTKTLYYKIKKSDDLQRCHLKLITKIVKFY